ncbi:hypothetical protein V6N13_031219 [Hibiscus sabdariffa]|uniref:Nucleoprotein n=1 Tax=Hibiscus sabdariffa TaxID=183260 RepID=A0ABR2CN63_9ROSI
MDSYVEKLLNAEVPEEFKDLEDIEIIWGRQGSDIWEDDDLKTMERLRFTRWDELDGTTRADILRLVSATFCTGVSVRGIAAVFQCAWGLRSAINPSALCFKEDIYLNPSKHNTYDNLDNTIMYSAGTSTTIKRPRGMDDVWFEVYMSYICASVLRLVTKSDQSYLKSWEHITRSFNTCYRKDFPVFFKPDAICVRAIRDRIHANLILKYSVAPFLVGMRDLNEIDQGMCKMLFEQHLAFTGMHAYPLMMKCVEKLSLSTSEVAAVLRYPVTEKALKTIQYIRSHYEFPETPEEKAMASKGSLWKYARIFYDNRFDGIQTKNCPYLVAILARAAKKLGVGGPGDITQIHHIAHMKGDQAERVESIASRLCQLAIGTGTGTGRQE